LNKPVKIKMKKLKISPTEFKILIMLAFFSLSVGLWENFRQLWLQDNGFSAQDVSTITSIGTLISIIGIVFVGQRLKADRLKNFMSVILFAKALVLLLLFSLDGSGDRLMINAGVALDVFTSCMIITSVYPLITTVIKSNRAYSRRKLVEYFFRDFGVLVGGILIGWQFFGASLDYNGCLLASVALLIPGLAILFRVKVRSTEKYASSSCSSVLKYIINSRLQRFYMLYAFLAATSFAAALGLRMLLLTNYLDFSASMATNYLLIVGLLSDVIGVVALKHFTPRNDYLTLTLKFGLRLLSYVVVVFASDAFVSLLAITWSILISTAYEDVTDGYYINLVDNRHQFSYSTIKYVMTYLGEAVGLLICGVTYEFGLAAVLGVAAVITAGQLCVAFYLIHLRLRRRQVRHSASRLRYHERIVDE